MENERPIIVWFRRDFRLSDHAALSAAASRGAPVIPLFVHDETVEALGAAPKWRMGRAIDAFDKTLRALGTRLILRRGAAKDALCDLVRETKAQAVYWSRAYVSDQVERDKRVKAALMAIGIEARSFTGHLLFEPWNVKTKTDGFYRVYTPMWKSVRDSELDAPLPEVTNLRPPVVWPDSELLDAWQMERAMRKGANIVGQHLVVGEEGARSRLNSFISGTVERYHEHRDFPAIEGTSRLSENLTYGEISPLTLWHAGWDALRSGSAGAETFLKEIVWREFAYHLAWHTPEILQRSWRPEWDRFPWRSTSPEAEAWKQGRTGVPFVDAAMREMYITGTMHNRGRMIVASYLTKHLMTHWKVGLDWFAECLVDWDPASNAMGWQWSAGSGPDATPYFRIFNPITQLEKFDKSNEYVHRFIAELSQSPSDTSLSYFDAIPESWGLRPSDPYPAPIVSMADGRVRALNAYQNHRSAD
ncbi:MAG: deoxyribodipyrimidine photo-lyase [Dinoroseobacter sp.]|nr:deoxyribodipyrimidine photo-lyase [Dinoroseobacter sp.]